MSDARSEEIARQEAEQNKRKSLQDFYANMDNWFAQYYMERQEVAYHFKRDQTTQDLREEAGQVTLQQVPGNEKRLAKTAPPEHGIYNVYIKDKDGTDIKQKFNLVYSEHGVRPSENTPKGWSAAIDFVARECLCDTMILSIPSDPANRKESEAKLRTMITLCIQKGVGAEPAGNTQLFINSLSASKQDEFTQLFALADAAKNETRMRRAEDWVVDENKEMDAARADRTEKVVIDKIQTDISERVANEIYIDTYRGRMDQGFTYEVTDMNGNSKKETVAWKEFPQSFEQDVKDFAENVANDKKDVALEKKVLGGVLDYTRKAGITFAVDKEWDALEKGLTAAPDDVKVGAAKKMIAELTSRMEKLEARQGRIAEVQQAEEAILADPEKVVNANDRKYHKFGKGGQVKSEAQVLKLVELSNPDNGKNKTDLLDKVSAEQKYCYKLNTGMKDQINKLGLTDEQKKELQPGLDKLEQGLKAGGTLETKREPLKSWDAKNGKRAETMAKVTTALKDAGKDDDSLKKAAHKESEIKNRVTTPKNTI